MEVCARCKKAQIAVENANASAPTHLELSSTGTVRREQDATIACTQIWAEPLTGALSSSGEKQLRFDSRRSDVKLLAPCRQPSPQRTCVGKKAYAVRAFLLTLQDFLLTIGAFARRRIQFGGLGGLVIMWPFTATKNRADRSARRAIAPRALLLLIAIAWMGREAQASCGDYVMVGHVHHGVSQTRTGQGGSHRMPSCQGPGCQKQLPTPLAPKSIVMPGPRECAAITVAHSPGSAGWQTLCANPAIAGSQVVILPPVPPPRFAD
jgi:hypothetical protein